MRTHRCIGLLVVLGSSGLVHAGDPFTLTAAGGGSNVTVSANDVVKLAGDLIGAENQFAALNGKSITGNLRYGSLDNAVLFTRNAAGTSATVTIPSTGFSKTFTAANEHDL